MNNKPTATQLITSYVKGTSTPEEAALVEAGFNHALNENDEFVSQEDIDAADQRMRSFINQHIQDTKHLQDTTPVKTLNPTWIKVAASLFIMMAVGAYFYIRYDQHKSQQALYAENIHPGRSKAELILANGQVINLDSAGNGQLASQSGIKLTKTASGQLVYTVTDRITGSTLQYNTIKTPNGGQYEVLLPDGTHVWLNAASSLKYPVNFSSVEKRRVQLTGEAYFEVAKKQIPFVVSTSQQQIEVLGTHFNVSVYSDDNYAKTTLMEGSVKVFVLGVDKTYQLKPGQESVNIRSASSITVKQANIESAIDWKNGQFVFNDEDLESIMRKIGRWYNVEIEFEDEQKKQAVFAGSISRFSDISKVLNKLELTGLAEFKLEPNKIIVLK